MAQLNSELFELAAATSVATLTTSRKLMRNFTCYRNRTGSGKVVYRDQMLSICRKIRMNAFGMHNLLEDKNNQHSPFLVSLAGEIHDSLEELHRKVLFFDAGQIETLVPELDSLRKFWNKYTDETFYFNLNRYFEFELPNKLEVLERRISTLPDSAAL